MRVHLKRKLVIVSSPVSSVEMVAAENSVVFATCESCIYPGIVAVSRFILRDPERSQSQKRAWPFLIDLIAHRAADRDHPILHFQMNAGLLEFDRFPQTTQTRSYAMYSSRY